MPNQETEMQKIVKVTKNCLIDIESLKYVTLTTGARQIKSNRVIVNSLNLNKILKNKVSSTRRKINEQTIIRDSGSSVMNTFVAVPFIGDVGDLNSSLAVLASVNVAITRAVLVSQDFIETSTFIDATFDATFGQS